MLLSHELKTMNQTLSSLRSILKALCVDYPEIVAVYLFGSYAKGEARLDSDFDLALLVKEPALNFPVLQFKLAVEDILGNGVDLVILNRAGEVLKHQVRRDGKLLYEKDSRKRKLFEVRSRKYFEDFKYLHNRYVKKILYEKAHD